MHSTYEYTFLLINKTYTYSLKLIAFIRMRLDSLLASQSFVDWTLFF